VFSPRRFFFGSSRGAPPPPGRARRVNGEGGRADGRGRGRLQGVKTRKGASSPTGGGTSRPKNGFAPFIFFFRSACGHHGGFERFDGASSGCEDRGQRTSSMARWEGKGFRLLGPWAYPRCPQRSEGRLASTRSPRRGTKGGGSNGRGQRGALPPPTFNGGPNPDGQAVFFFGRGGGDMGPGSVEGLHPFVGGSGEGAFGLPRRARGVDPTPGLMGGRGGGGVGGNPGLPGARSRPLPPAAELLFFFFLGPTTGLGRLAPPCPGPSGADQRGGGSRARGGPVKKKPLLG